MLRTRVITAAVLLAVLLPILFSRSFLFFALVAATFFGAAIWESLRLFGSKHLLVPAILWTAVFVVMMFKVNIAMLNWLFALCTAIWVLRLAPSLGIGLPAIDGVGNRLLNAIYCIALLGCFIALLALFQHSPLYLLSVMGLVWIADIGAYFAGKALGRHKLAPSISPGKSWEGAIGGWLAVLLMAGASTMHPSLADTFASRIRMEWGWPGFVAVMTLLVAVSIVGDLFESQLKRRVSMKDSSNLLPGHGGVLDRIDALIPALPLAVLLNSGL